MNATEDGLEPLGESPAMEPMHTVPVTKYPPVEAVTYWRARCTSCGAYAEYYEFGAFSDFGSAIEAARDECEWFDRVACEPAPTADNPRRQLCRTVELLCRDCQRCEVCGSSPAYVLDDGEPHVVCEGHEDHDFDSQATPAARPKLSV